VTFADWEVFSRWENSQLGRRPADYLALKETLSGLLRAQFGRYFPALAPLVVHSELSTPVSSLAFTGAYTAWKRARAGFSRPPCARAKTPVTGLYLTGQDVGNPGITGAMMGRILSAAALEPTLFTRIG
jgi:all-trans-retinol 13,14-reductase